MNKKITHKIDKRLSLERGTIYKGHGGRITIALVYPNNYKIGMSNLGFQGIYGLLNSSNHVVCERAFLPDDEDFKEHQRTGLPIVSYETKTPLNRFDIIAFSVSFEMDYLNIVKILSTCKIPLVAKERREDSPLIIAGGVCCSSNPEPIADIFDIIFIGEGEELIFSFLDLFISNENKNKKDLLKKCLQLDGIYIPSHFDVNYKDFVLISRKSVFGNEYETVKKVTFNDFSIKPITTIITTPESEFSNMHLIEVMRGCVWRCRFCLVGSLYNPVRMRELEVINEKIIALKDDNVRIGLIAPSLTDYKHIDTMLSTEDVCLSITSIRASSRAIKIVDSLKGIKSISIAPETGNDRLRGVINKKIKDADILYISEYIFNKGIDTLRLYFMIGLPTESNRDIEDIVNLIRKIRTLSSRATLSITISIFVPKPFTPFQWYGLPALKEIRQKISYLSNAVKGFPKTTIRTESPRYAFMQAVLSRGGRYLLRHIINTSWKQTNNEIISDRDLQKHFGINWDFETLLPWDFIEYPSISKRQLWLEYIKALEEGGNDYEMTS